METLWFQWAAIGGMASAARDPKSIVDPEALVLTSLLIGQNDRGDLRFNDVTASWGVLNSRLLSVQRLNNLAKQYSLLNSDLGASLGSLAHLWLKEGKDYRWKSIAVLSPEFSYRSNKLRSIEVVTDSNPSLMLRLRKIFGIGIRADVLSFLIGEFDIPQSVRSISRATGYTLAPVRRALAEMVDARIIDRSSVDGPDHFRVDMCKWSPVLGLQGKTPDWSYWNESFQAAMDLINFSKYLNQPLGRIALGALARELMERHRFVFTGLLGGRTNIPANSDTLQVMETSIRHLSDYLRREV